MTTAPRKDGAVKEVFDQHFKNWQIRLPLDDFQLRRRGKICRNGWAIWYLFDRDEKREYLDYYASHRMTDDRHIRIYFDGTTEALPAIQGMRIASDDPEEDAQLEIEYRAKNQRIVSMLEAKGFGVTGDEPMGVQVNRSLRQ